MSKALVFSIEEFSVFDGPGIRTSVFLCGCPLSCSWCHNPEGQSFQNSILRSPNGCIGCGECTKYAKNENGRLCFSEKSIKSCPQGLLRYSAREYSPHELCAELEKNSSILSSAGGGVTFSGGEPTASPQFLLECLEILNGKLHRAVQTCGFCSAEIFDRVLEACDYMLFDIKLTDEAEHKRYTGVSNTPILKNFSRLAQSGKPFVVRTPLIPGVTDTEANIGGIARILKDNGVGYIELLPYNKAAGAKYPLVGKEYKPQFDTTAEIHTQEEIFAEYGIKAKII